MRPDGQLNKPFFIWKFASENEMKIYLIEATMGLQSPLASLNL